MISAVLDWWSCWLSLFDRVRLDALALICLPMFQSIPTFAIVNQGSRARINDCNDLIMNRPWRCQWHHIAVFILSQNQTYQHEGLPSPDSKEFWISGCIRQAMHPWAHKRLLHYFWNLPKLEVTNFGCYWRFNFCTHLPIHYRVSFFKIVANSL